MGIVRKEKIGYSKDSYQRNTGVSLSIERTDDMAQYYVGVDVGGTTVKMGMFSDTGELFG